MLRGRLSLPKISVSYCNTLLRHVIESEDEELANWPAVNLQREIQNQGRKLQARI